MAGVVFRMTDQLASSALGRLVNVQGVIMMFLWIFLCLGWWRRSANAEHFSDLAGVFTSRFSGHSFVSFVLTRS